MKAVMMIKALILVHLWSLILAGGAWALQRDGEGRIGARFPAPHIWLSLIVLSLLPGVLHLLPLSTAISLPDIEIPELIPVQISEAPAQTQTWLGPLAVYMGLSFLLVVRTLWKWSRLQCLPLTPTTDPRIYTTLSKIPPLALSWPRRAIVIPCGFESQTALIRHERTHLNHHDAEFTLLLLLLQDAMLRNPGISYLVRQWRLSIELRADRAAISTLTAPQRKDYAAFLLNLQRPNRPSDDTLPCPTARLGSKGHRNVKMRLAGIIENEPVKQTRRWVGAVLCASIAASGIGLLSAAATTTEAFLDANSGQVTYIKKAPPQLPAHCPGLENDLKARGFKYEEVQTTVEGRLVSLHSINLGAVVLSHDVRKDGSVHNLRILNSTLPCFEAEARIALSQRMAEPQELETRNVVTKVKFIMSAKSPEKLNEQLKKYLR